MLDAPAQDKMMKAAPSKKGFHFASDGIHLAEFIEAENIDEATDMYHKIKRLITPLATPLSTHASLPKPEREEKEVQ